MSIELSVFSEHACDPAAVAASMARNGWGVRFQPDEGFVLGWCPAWADAPAASLELRELPWDRYAAVGLGQRVAQVQAMRALAHGAPRLAPRLLSARRVHLVWTSAGRSRLGYALQLALWHAIGEATDGVLYNETSGELMLAEEMGAEPAPASPEISPAGPGNQAPDFELLRQDGKRFSLTAYRGQPVTLWFLPSGLRAPFAEQEGEALSKGQALLKKRTVLVGLGPISAAEWSLFAARFGLRFPLLGDASEVVHAYDAHQQKLTVIIGPDGTIRERFVRQDARSVFELMGRLEALQKAGRLW